MGARWYDAQLGRWISADTIVPDSANPQSFNRFTYVLGNPLRYTDPTGHFERDEVKQILINGKIASEGGTAEDWEDWAEGIVSDWEEDAEWWELLRKAEVGDILDGIEFSAMFSSGGGEPNRWIGMFYEGRNGKIHFKYRRIEADKLGDEPYWDLRADQLVEVLSRLGLDEFYGDGKRVDILLIHQGSDGHYAAFAGTGIYYMPHLGYDTPRIKMPEPDIWRDWAVGWVELTVGAYTGIGIPWGLAKGLPKIDNYLYEKASVYRLQTYGY
jgi:hypothetical protein